MSPRPLARAILIMAGLTPIAAIPPAATAANPAASTASCESVPPAEVIRSLDESLDGASAVADDDAWAVGYSYNGLPQALIEHWDGTTWSQAPAGGQGVLQAVDGRTTDDVWAVGNTLFFGGSTLIEHWDGSTWTVVPSPNRDINNFLYGVEAISATDVWAVGSTDHFTAESLTLTMHWDGSTWNVVPSPNPGSPINNLHAVAGAGAADVWAVGRTTGSGNAQPLTLHWNGTAWKVDTTSVTERAAYLQAVATIASTDVWAVGGYNDLDFSTLTEHRSASGWSAVPDIGAQSSNLAGVAARGSDDAWAVGTQSARFPYRSIAEHWDGTGWSGVRTEPVGSASNYLFAATASTSDTWAVGRYVLGEHTHALIERC